MEKYWICILLLTVASVTAQHDDDSYLPEWADYSDLYDYDSLIDSEEKNDNNDKQKDTQLSLEDKKSKEEFEQIEDNRSAQNPDEINDELKEKNDEKNDENSGTRNSDEEQSNSKENINSEENPGEKKADNVDSSVYMDDKLVSPELKEDNISEKVKKADDDNEAKNTNIEDVIEETKQILKDTNDDFEENDENKEANNSNNDETNDKYVEEASKDILGSSKGDLIDEDTVDKVYQDLNKDLDKLMETWKKLNDENNDYIEPENNADDAMDPDQISEYEKKYGVPYGEKYVLSLREQNYDDANNDEKMSDEVDDDENDDDTVGKEKEEFIQKSLTENSGPGNTDHKDTKDNEFNDENKNDDDDLFKDDPNADDATSEEYDSSEVNDNAVAVKKEVNGKLIEAGDDAILDDNVSDIDDDDETNNEPVVPKSMLRDSNDDMPVEKKSTSAAFSVETQSSSNDEIASSTVTKAVTAIDVSNLNPHQYDQLMEEFIQAHADELDISRFDSGRNVAPIHVTLTQEPLIVTSPNYPSPYPTNNIVDWMFTGKGVGIELIITNFFVNGVSGDYLLIKPGGIDASGRDGLVFSHMLNEPRRYRFLDVDKMFVRFEARPGLSFRPGFSFSVRMVLPREDDSELIETLPEPEALLPEPVETFTVLIGGPTLPEFNATIEKFRLLIADMATVYINSNDIDPGLNTTRQITQITNVAVCNLNWPNSDRCSEVSFGVPLVYGDEDKDRKPRLKERELRAMWYLYSTQDPFAVRLRNMGMEEFTSPNDSDVLTVWLVIGFGLLISMAMLAFALWRFSCFENYARMPTYSDRDSVYSEKQGLDLYPTPHQTLPPLFAENEYKWDNAKFEDSTGDMGGFTNKSYNRDELFDIDSDEDVIPPNKRDRGYQPRGFEV